MIQPTGDHKVQGKPAKISFDDPQLFEQVSELLQSDELSATVSSSGIVFRDLPQADNKTLVQLFTEYKKTN